MSTSTEKSDLLLTDHLRDLAAKYPNDEVRQALFELGVAVEELSATYYFIAETPFNYITHDLKSENLTVQVWQKKDEEGQTHPIVRWSQVIANVGIIDENRIVIELASSLLGKWVTHEYKVVLHA